MKETVAPALAKEVSRVFARGKCPPAHSISETPGNDDQTAEYFAGKSWQSLTESDLMPRRSPLIFFTPSAFVYFVPAFLRIALETANPDLVGAAVDALTPQEQPQSPSYWRWWVLLTAQQQRAVIKCLQHWESFEEGRWLEPAAKALESTLRGR